MAYTLGGVILPNPKSFRREFIETSWSNTLIDNTLKKKINNRKERFILTYQYLSQNQANNILSEFELNEVREFTVSEDNLSISATGVLIDVSKREFMSAGKEFRQNLTLILTETL